MKILGAVAGQLSRHQTHGLLRHVRQVRLPPARHRPGGERNQALPSHRGHCLRFLYWVRPLYLLIFTVYSDIIFSFLYIIWLDLIQNIV